MIPESFNHGWGVRPKTNPFFDLVSATPYAPVTLPHDAMIGRPRAADVPSGAMVGFFPGGEDEYLKQLAVPVAWESKRIFLEFEGVYRDARVFVNGTLAAHRPNGYAGFVVQLDPYLKYGEQNSIKVECTAHEDARWYSGEGIYRPVHLYVGGLVHLGVQTMKITPTELDGSTATIEVEDTIVNESSTTKTVRVVTEILDESNLIIATDSVPLTIFPGEEVVTRRRLFLDGVHRWGPTDPFLYGARVALHLNEEEIDRSEARFGIRSLQLDVKHGLRINGEAINLRGACVHHDNGPIGAATIGRAEERRVELLQAAGFNAIRSAHNPMSRAMLNACDRLGVLVMDEAFDSWTLNKARFDYSRDFDTWWQRDLEEMVRKDYNHPSVIMYSIGNEIGETGNALDSHWGRGLAELVRSLDPHRYTVNCMNGLMSVVHDLGVSVPTESAFGINDMLASMVDFAAQLTSSEMVSVRTEEAMSQVDVTGYNYGDSRYEMDVERFPNRISVGSETSRSSIARNWELIERFPHVIGDFCWTGWDYMGEVGVGRFDQGEGDDGGVTGPFPYLSAAAGDLDMTGNRLPVSYYRETVFGLRREPYIAVHRPSRFENSGKPTAWSWTDSLGSWTWDGDEGKPVRIDVYSDAEEVELVRNSITLGIVSVGQVTPLVATFETTYEPGELVAIARSGGRETGRSRLVSAKGPLTLVARSDLTVLEHSDDALAFIRISLVDAKGVLNPSQTRRVRAIVSGSGILQALGSGDPKPLERLDTNERATFNGSALAILRPTEVGTITVTVTSDEFDPAVVEIVVR